MKSKPVSERGKPSSRQCDTQPLLRLLVAEATRRGHTLAELAKRLGVTYGRLTQWRRNESAMANAHASVLELSAQYLGVPTVVVLVIAQKIGLQQFVWPTKASLTDRISREIDRLRRDPFLGAFVPAELTTASPALQLFVVFLFHELEGDESQGKSMYNWLTLMHQAAVGNVDAQSKLDELRGQASQNQHLF